MIKVTISHELTVGEMKAPLQLTELSGVGIVTTVFEVPPLMVPNSCF
jgi:hypothetical protein